MEITRSTVSSLTFTGLERLDPITVYMEEFSDSVARVLIHCGGDVYTASWSAMGGVGLMQFLVNCDDDYLAKNLCAETKPTISDYDAFYHPKWLGYSLRSSWEGNSQRCAAS